MLNLDYRFVLILSICWITNNVHSGIFSKTGGIGSVFKLFSKHPNKENQVFSALDGLVRHRRFLDKGHPKGNPGNIHGKLAPNSVHHSSLNQIDGINLKKPLQNQPQTFLGVNSQFPADPSSQNDHSFGISPSLGFPYPYRPYIVIAPPGGNSIRPVGMAIHSKAAKQFGVGFGGLTNIVSTGTNVQGIGPGPPGPPGAPGRPGAPGPPGAAPVGPPGAPGPPGRVIPGPRGADGADGAFGVVGVPGIPGVPGQNGPPGNPGANGANGVPGTPGDPGADGLQGPAGVNGVDGVDGVNGANGVLGPPGPAGVRGSKGQRGANGANGAFGAAGPIGTQGAPGPPGLPGPPGAAGIPGTPGVPGTPGMFITP